MSMYVWPPILIAAICLSPGLLAYMIDPNEPMSSTRFLGGIKGTLSPMNVSIVIASGG